MEASIVRFALPAQIGLPLPAVASAAIEPRKRFRRGKGDSEIPFTLIVFPLEILFGVIAATYACRIVGSARI
jgi:hypothetical protein